MGKKKVSFTASSVLATDVIEIIRAGVDSKLEAALSALVTFLSTGFTTLSGLTSVAATTFTGNLTGNVTGGIKLPVTEGTTSTYALAATDSGRVYVATATSGTQTYTLPTVTNNAGVYYTFICGHAGGEILITPQASQAIVITSFAAVGADADTGIIAPAAGTGIKNTAGSNAIGDSITLVCSGTKWFSVGITSGIWASQ